jgi:uncharacterized protein YbjT (DUF2867 family)
VVHALRSEDRPVRALVRSASSRGAQQLRNWGVELVEGDVGRPDDLRAAVEGVETVVHLVAILTGRPPAFERLMSGATRELVSAAQSAGVRRLVLMSALGASEATKDLVPYYGAKWAMEQAVKGSSLEHVIFRPSFVFGPDGGALKQFKQLARFAPVTPIVGSGTQRIQPIWIDDVAAYFAAAIDSREAAGRTFELGGPDIVTWNEFWELLKKTLGVRRPSVHVPTGLLRAQAALLERLPNPPVTRDQLTMLEAGDNVVSNDDAVRVFQLPLVPLADQLRRAA